MKPETIKTLIQVFTHLSLIFFVIFNPEKIGSWIGTLLKSIEIVMQK